jgi:hypothetical protein
VKRSLAADAVAGVDFTEGARAAAEEAALAHPALRECLPYNPGLTEKSWFALYPAKPLPKAPIAQALAGRRLSKAQVAHLLTAENRAGVFLSLLEYNELDRDEQVLLMGNRKGFNAQVARKLITMSWVAGDLVKPIALAAGGQVLLSYLANADVAEVPDGEAADLLRTFRQWGPGTGESGGKTGLKQRSVMLQRLLGRRPGLLAAAVSAGQHESVVTAAAGNLHLRDPELQWTASGLREKVTADVLEARRYALMALVNNPVCVPDVVEAVIAAARTFGQAQLLTSAMDRKTKHPEPVTVTYDQVDDPEVLRWLVSRSRPSEYKPDGRPFDLAALAGNPHLTEFQVKDIADALSGEAFMRQLGNEIGRAARLAFTAAYPDNAPEWWAQDAKQYDDLESNDVDELSQYPPWVMPQEQALQVNVKDLEHRYEPSSILVHACDRLGNDRGRWETFFTLLDEFDGTLDDLLTVCLLV